MAFSVTLTVRNGQLHLLSFIPGGNEREITLIPSPATTPFLSDHPTPCTHPFLLIPNFKILKKNPTILG